MRLNKLDKLETDLRETNKPATAQVGAISKAQKDENHFFYNWRQQKISKN